MSIYNYCMVFLEPEEWTLQTMLAFATFPEVAKAPIYRSAVKQPAYSTDFYKLSLATNYYCDNYH